MEEKYIKNNVWQLHSPLQHVGTFVTKSLNSDGQVKSRKIAIISKNIGSKKITAYKGLIKSKDAFNNDLNDATFKVSEVEKFNRGFLYGEDTYFSVPIDAVSFEIYFESIVYDDLSQTDFESFKFTNLNEIKLEKPSPQLSKIWQIISKDFKIINVPYFAEHFFICGCGALNLINQKTCVNCLSNTKEVQKLSLEDYMLEINDAAIKEFEELKVKIGYPLHINAKDINNLSENKEAKLKELNKILDQLNNAQKKVEKLSPITQKSLESNADYKKIISSIKLVKSKIRELEVLIESEEQKKKKNQINQELVKIKTLIKAFDTEFNAKLLTANHISWNEVKIQKFEEIYNKYYMLPESHKQQLNRDNVIKNRKKEIESYRSFKGLKLFLILIIVVMLLVILIDSLT